MLPAICGTLSCLLLREGGCMAIYPKFPNLLQFEVWIVDHYCLSSLSRKTNYESTLNQIFILPNLPTQSWVKKLSCENLVCFGGIFISVWYNHLNFLLMFSHIIHGKRTFKKVLQNIKFRYIAIKLPSKMKLHGKLL